MLDQRRFSGSVRILASGDLLMNAAPLALEQIHRRSIPQNDPEALRQNKHRATERTIPQDALTGQEQTGFTGVRGWNFFCFR
jgi:hypothetical protein